MKFIFAIQLSISFLASFTCEPRIAKPAFLSADGTNFSISFCEFASPLPSFVQNGQIPHIFIVFMIILLFSMLVYIYFLY